MLLKAGDGRDEDAVDMLVKGAEVVGAAKCSVAALADEEKGRLCEDEEAVAATRGVEMAAVNGAVGKFDSAVGPHDFACSLSFMRICTKSMSALMPFCISETLCSR